MLRNASFYLLCATIAAAGCKQEPGLKTYPVKGSVTYNGKPVAGATVSYINDESSAPRCSSVTDSDGRFSLSTFLSAKEVLPGAPSGSYKIVIVKMSAAQQQATAEANNWENLSEQERQAQMTGMWQKQNKPQQQAPEKPKSEIPERYGNPETSGLVATVVVGENEPREVKLTDD